MTILKIAAVIGAAGLVAGGGFLYSAFGAFLPWRERAEFDRLAELAGVAAGQTVADIGAGTGRLSVALARRVGAAGKVYATELSAANRDAIRRRAGAGGAANLVVVDADARGTKLPDGSCDLIVMRNVYHHIADPDAFGPGVRRALRDGGRLAVIDFEPGALWFHGGRPAEASVRRPGHGVSRAAAIAEFGAAGFTVEREIPAWGGPMWLVLFRASERGR